MYLKCFDCDLICIQDAVDAGPELDDWEADHAGSIVQHSGDHADAIQEMYRRRQAEKEKKEKKEYKPGRNIAHLSAYPAGAADPDQLGETYPGGQLRGEAGAPLKQQMQPPSRGKREEPRPASLPQVVGARPGRGEAEVRGRCFNCKGESVAIYYWDEKETRPPKSR